jgi:hypothetical protein
MNQPQVFGQSGTESGHADASPAKTGRSWKPQRGRRRRGIVATILANRERARPTRERERDVPGFFAPIVTICVSYPARATPRSYKSRAGLWENVPSDPVTK